MKVIKNLVRLARKKIFIDRIIVVVNLASEIEIKKHAASSWS